MLSRDSIFQEETYKRNCGLHARLHAKNLDREIGYKIPKIEEKLNQKFRSYYQSNDESNRKKHFQSSQSWIGLHPQVLQTPYNDIHECLSKLKDTNIDLVIDIGSGYGRVGMVMNSIFPKANFIGYEVIKKREAEGNRIFKKYGLNNCKIINKNVLEDGFVLPNAQIYFIYDFSEMSDICKILDDLVCKAKDKSFYLIARGDRMDYLINKKYKSFWRKFGFIEIEDLKIYRCG